MTLWFHPPCAAYRRPEALLEGLASGADVPGRESLERVARASTAQRRLPRIEGAHRSPSSQATCRQCRETIPKGEWRIRLSIFDEGRFNPAGFIHLACGKDYFETGEFREQLLHFTQDLAEADREDLRAACAG